MKIGIFLPNATFDLPGSPEVGGIETFSFTVGEALQRLGKAADDLGNPEEAMRHFDAAETLRNGLVRFDPAVFEARVTNARLLPR